MNIPEGYVLVPVELTQEMIQAGIDTECVDTGDEDFDETQDYIAVYKSFLESAPKAPAYDEAKERELFELLNPRPGRIEWSFKNSRYIGSSDLYSISNYQSRWAGWKACAKSRARSAE